MKIAGAGLIAAAVLGLVGCAPEAEPEPTPVAEAPTPTPTPTPTPEPMPGEGPECPTDHCVSVAVAGDFLFHEGLWSPFAIETNDEGHNFDFMPLLEGIKPYLDRTDLAICQMETPLAPVGGPYAGYPIFSTPPELADTAKDIGFDVCTTASNHTVDMGTEGLLRTLDRLDEVGIAHTGSYREEGDRDEPLIVEANGAKIAVITSTFSLNGMPVEYPWQVDYRDEEPRVDPERTIAKAQAARDAGADIVIGVQHIGEEYWSEPTPGQRELGLQLLDSDLFDFVYQHHAHAVQPLEEHNGRWILYGTGNLISEKRPARAARQQRVLADARAVRAAGGRHLGDERRRVGAGDQHAERRLQVVLGGLGCAAGLMPGRSLRRRCARAHPHHRQRVRRRR